MFRELVSLLPQLVVQMPFAQVLLADGRAVVAAFDPLLNFGKPVQPGQKLVPLLPIFHPQIQFIPDVGWQCRSFSISHIFLLSHFL
jgi:hypothetical protein